MLVAGIDGGATRTRAAVASGEGRLLGYGTAGPSNVDNVSVEEARSAIAAAVEQALAQAGLQDARLDAAFFGMAGIVAEADREVLLRLARQIDRLRGSTIGIDHDIRIALAGAIPDDVGIVLIAGTGSSCYGRREDGRSHQTGWGYLLDDEGSSFALGLEAMRAAVRDFDGRGTHTALTPLVLKHLGIASIPEILHALYHRRTSIPEIAAFAPTVLELAAQGDPVAYRCLRHGALELSRMVFTVAQRLGFLRGSMPVAMVGGLVESSPFYRAEIRRAIRERLPGAAFLEASLPPVLGAVRLAFRLSGLQVSDDIQASLVASRTLIEP